MLEKTPDQCLLEYNLNQAGFVSENINSIPQQLQFLNAGIKRFGLELYNEHKVSSYTHFSYKPIGKYFKNRRKHRFFVGNGKIYIFYFYEFERQSRTACFYLLF